ncbi:MAG: hypothetical protein ACON39_02360 [Coraliomargaritaceae bacterium]
MMKNAPLFLFAAGAMLPVATMAIDLVDFDASQSVVSQAVQSIDRTFQLVTPIISPVQNENYSGSPIYGSFQSQGKALCGVSPKEGAGLKIRWNPKNGMMGDKLSGLFLFKKTDFLNGSGKQIVSLSPGSDEVSAQVGYSNPGKHGPEYPVQSASFRLVIKDNTGWFISQPMPIESKKSLLLKATTLEYSSYSIMVNRPGECGQIRSQAVPSFRDIRFIGFRLDAVRGSDIAGGSNIGVTEFSVKGTFLESN